MSATEHPNLQVSSPLRRANIRQNDGLPYPISNRPDTVGHPPNAENSASHMLSLKV